MAYKDQELTDREVQEAVGSRDHFEDGEEILEFVRAQVNEWEDPELKRGDPREEFADYDRDVPKYLLINLTYRVAEDSPGQNAKGSMIRFRYPTASLLLDANDDVVIEHERTLWSQSSLTRILMAFFGGKGTKDTGDYPKTESGNLRGPVSVLLDDVTAEQLAERRAGCVFATKFDKEGVPYTIAKAWHKV